ncbi:MAG: helix-hairpin-helix domain-containing protein, partial [Thermodesulfobacteriota bacterium]
MQIIFGLLEKISYHNEENDFVVAKLREKEKKELTTIVGNLSGVNPGESLKLTGKWVQNKRFGEQFQVESFEVTVPATLHGIQKYLASGLIQGIGPIMSERIVEKFGIHTLEVIEKKPERLSEVEGIGPKRISMIRKAWGEQKEIKEIMIFLQGHGVGAAYSAKIYKRYGDQSIEMVRENPYRLAHDIYGIGFMTADKIAQNLGIDRNSLIRAKAGLLYILNQLTEEGHVYYPETQLIHKAREILHVDEEIIILAVKELSKEKELFLEDL